MFTFDNFRTYVKENPTIDIMPTIVKGDSMSYLNLQLGVKTSQLINVITDAEAIIQAGSYTGTDNYKGGTDLAQVKIEVVRRFIKEAYDNENIEDNIMQAALKPGTNPDDMPAVLKNGIMLLKEQSMNRKNEESLWLGDTAYTLPFPTPSNDAERLANAKVRHILDFNGFVKQAKNSATAIKTGSAPVTITSTNVLAEVQKFVDTVNGIEELVDQQMTLFMNPAAFQIYIQKLGEKYVATWSIRDTFGRITSIPVWGTNITAKSTLGMKSDDTLICARPKNLVVGTDLLSETDKFTFEWLTEALHWRLLGLYKLGCKIYNESEIIVNKA